MRSKGRNVFVTRFSIGRGAAAVFGPDVHTEAALPEGRPRRWEWRPRGSM